ncbi:glycogen synthase [Candidatus Parcubacteria bacterium]|nr:glycogen synthase [Candidatus Parcubacteria bacterium]
MIKKRPKILFVSAECSPFAKVGGLGDVAGSLPIALRKLRSNITIVIPKYDIISQNYFSKKIIEGIKVKGEKVNVWQGFLPRTEVPVYFLENKKFFGNHGVYFGKTVHAGSFKEIERFLFFSQAVLELASFLDAKLIHCNDWHTAMIPILAKLQQPKIKTILTIHNLGSQGKDGSKKILDFLKLEPNQHPNLKVRGKDHNFNILQQGILAADIVNTVSPTYCKEILTAKFGAGLEKDLRKRKKDLCGIINGLDTERFNPQKNKNLAKNYSLATIERKAVNKEELQKICGLPLENVPLLGLVGRLTYQKGIKIIAAAFPSLAKMGCQVIILGSGGKEREAMLKKLAKLYPKNLSLHLKFDTVLAQKIYAGSDMFLMPSEFEPCGLGQLISQRYGTIPIVREVGGLADTVAEGKTGFLFKKYTSTAFLKAVRNALKFYQDEKKWKKMVKQAMVKDFSWRHSAKEYAKIYRKLLSKPAA